MRQLASIVVFLCLIAALAGRHILQPAMNIRSAAIAADLAFHK
jgi:hypothetical protein